MYCTCTINTCSSWRCVCGCGVYFTKISVTAPNVCRILLRRVHYVMPNEKSEKFIKLAKTYKSSSDGFVPQRLLIFYKCITKNKWKKIQIMHNRKVIEGLQLFAIFSLSNYKFYKASKYQQSFSHMKKLSVNLGFDWFSDIFNSV